MRHGDGNDRSPMSPPIACLVASNRPVGPRIHELRIVPATSALARTYTTPGQYVTLGLPDEGKDFFALASPPSDLDEWVFLVKRGSRLADALASRRVGRSVEASRAQGRGYPLGECGGKDLWLVALGTGIAPVAAAIEECIRRRPGVRSLELYHWAGSEVTITLPETFLGWVQTGISVILGVTHPVEERSWLGRRGSIQQHMRAPRDPGNLLVFIGGPPRLLAEVRAALAPYGVRPDQVVNNVD